MITLKDCSCGKQPKQGLTEVGLYRVICVKMDGGCSKGTDTFKTQDLADKAWNEDFLKKNTF